MLANRVRKRHAHLAPRFARERVEAFRLYDWDIPEIRAVVDWYAGHLVVSEYERLQTGPDWLPSMADAVASALGVPPDRLHMKRRRTGPDRGDRYGRGAAAGQVIVVSERDLRFRVDLGDALDTGLFPDHRDTRAMLRAEAAGRDFLNLYAYTGTFTCAAAAGGARSTVTVDRSAGCLDRAADNLDLNGLSGGANRLVRADAREYLARARKAGERFGLVLLDPPSFSGTRDSGDAFDVNRDHPALVASALEVAAPGGSLWFSTNHQRFEPRLDSVPAGLASEVVEVTARTLPPDYRDRNRTAHRCWRIVRA
ncbi:MAG: class I SAM-dependent methyltransferase [Deltaproteobacteria bacterium]|nr:class I SAM-dependent methyltransferase [Deltaproteobacteria bacterium]